MKVNGQSLLRLMFDPGDSICISDSQFANYSVNLDDAIKDEIVLRSSNEGIPARTVNTDNIIFSALNPINGSRNDRNCYKFRNFLIELDNYERDLQIGYIKKLGIPYSAMIWSGSKSTHTLISLTEPFLDEKTYRTIYKWILGIASLSDQALGNPSRSIRLAGAIRPETGKEQELIELKSRVSHKELFDWLNKYPHLRPKAKEKRIIPEGQYDFYLLGPWTRGMLTKGIEFKKGRNQTWYALAMDFALAGATEESTIEILGKHFQEEHDFKEKEWLTTIASAFKTVAEGRN